MLKNISINAREVRSFRLRFRILNIYSFLKQKESVGLFMFCYGLQPKERYEFAEKFNKQDIEVSGISSNTLKFFFSSERWKMVTKLLEGGIVLVKDKKNRVLLKQNVVRMLEDKRFFFRLFFWGFRLSRNFLIENWLKISTIQEAIVVNMTVVREKFILFLFLFQIYKTQKNQNA